MSLVLSGFRRRWAAEDEARRRSGEREGAECEAPGCGRSTRERKRFCTEHVDWHPYVVALLARIEAREESHQQALAAYRTFNEKDDARGLRKLDLRTITPREIATALVHFGGRTAEGLARLCGLDDRVTLAFVEAMVKQKVARRILGTRAQVLVVLSGRWRSRVFGCVEGGGDGVG